jgi:hypothetical protein
MQGKVAQALREQAPEIRRLLKANQSSIMVHDVSSQDQEKGDDAVSTTHSNQDAPEHDRDMSHDILEPLPIDHHDPLKKNSVEEVELDDDYIVFCQELLDLSMLLE